MQQGPMQTEVKDYKSPKDFQSDAAHRAGSGWVVVTQTSQPQRPGCLRMLLLSPIGAYIFRPKPHIIATYQRAKG